MLQVVEGFDSVDEDQVGACRAIGVGATLNVVPSVDCEGVGARDDYEILIAAGVAGGAHFRHHRFRRDDLLACEETASLGEHLIFDVQGRCAGVFVLAHGAPYVERIAVTGVGVANYGDVYRLRNSASVRDHLGHRKQAEVGEPRAAAVPKPVM